MKGILTITKWKFILILAGMVILALSMAYTNYLAQKLSEGEFDKMNMLTLAYAELADSTDLDKDVSLPLQIVERNQDIPVISTDLNDRIIWARSFGPERDTNMTFLKKQLEEIKKEGPPPIVNNSRTGAFKIYYTESKLLRLLTFFPIFQLLLLIAFISIGFIGFSATKKAEQNRVWVGMAKETAHQLGTPISAILAWVEHLRNEASLENKEIVEELANDVNRLELIADRFSKIGSKPALERVNLYAVLENTREYMEKRASRRIRFDFPDKSGEPLIVSVNVHLFSWVLENIIRNALDAMEGEGTISAKVTRVNKHVRIDIRDTGKGIPTSQLKKVFEPGFTTKQRGWGLGLSLAKRIIENYHQGRIYVKESKTGEGTAFSIELPL